MLKQVSSTPSVPVCVREIERGAWGSGENTDAFTHVGMKES